jgi:predicted transcriptional regulator
MELRLEQFEGQPWRSSVISTRNNRLRVDDLRLHTSKRNPCVKRHINEAPVYGQVKYRSAKVVNTPDALYGSEGLLPPSFILPRRFRSSGLVALRGRVGMPPGRPGLS